MARVRLEPGRSRGAHQHDPHLGRIGGGVALLIGVPLAFLLTRSEFRGRRLLSAVATLPAALPPLVGVIAFLFLYGESGVVTRSVQHLLGLDHAPWRLTGLWAIIFVHAYTMYVYVFLFVAAGLENYDATLDEAAAGLGARQRA